jgi:hypothetical protein
MMQAQQTAARGLALRCYRLVMRRVGGVFAVLLVIGSALLSGGIAHADGGDEPQYAEFYTPPDPLPPGKPVT